MSNNTDADEQYHKIIYKNSTLFVMIANIFFVWELLILLYNGILWSKNMIQTNLHINSIALRNDNNMIYVKNVYDNNGGMNRKESYLNQNWQKLNTTLVSLGNSKKECLPISKYFVSDQRSILIKFKPKENLEISHYIEAMRGVILFSIINNASFCTDYNDYFSYMDNTLHILLCKNKSIVDFWDESYAIQWIKRHDCNYHVKQHTEITAGYDLSIHISHCDSFIDSLLINTDQLNSKEYKETVTKFIFQPKKSIQHTVEMVLSKLNYHFIGIDIFMEQDSQLITFDSNVTYQAIQQIRKKIAEFDNSFSVFVSSNIPVVKEEFKNVQKNILFIDDIEFRLYSLNVTSYEKDILSISILSHCTILIHTLQSRNGVIASEISNKDKIYIING